MKGFLPFVLNQEKLFLLYQFLQTEGLLICKRLKLLVFVLQLLLEKY